MDIVGATHRSWAKDNQTTLVSFISSCRDAIRWLKEPGNRAQTQALLMRNDPTRYIDRSYWHLAMQK